MARPPRLVPDRCARSWRTAPCYECHDACPVQGALELRPLPRFGAGCVTCGACAAACPPGALDWRPSWPAGEPPAVVACARADAGNVARVPCLSALGLDELANLVRVRGSVTVIPGKCEGCDLAASLGIWLRNRDRIRSVLVALGEPESRLSERDGPVAAGPVPDRGVNLGRRGFLFNLWTPPANASGSALKQLVDRHPGPRRQSAGDWFAPSLLQGCDGCGRCASACPTGALEKKGAGFVADPILCRPECRLCAEVCPRRCLEVGRSGRTPDPVTLVLPSLGEGAVA
ncbi:MAG: 4Fe-4S binding protein [Thermoanaerobaculia bacterium]